MADLSITAASVVPVSGARIVNGTCGGTATAGQTAYQNAGLWYPGNALTSATTAAVRGVFLNSSSPGQPCSLATGGNVTIGATMVQGGVYLSSGLADGGINDGSDITTGWYTEVVGIAQSSTVLTLLFGTSSPQTTHA